MQCSLVLEDHKAYLENSKKYDLRMNSLKNCLGLRVEIRKNFLFRDLWAFIKKDQSFFENVFAAHMGGYLLDPYIEDAESEVNTDEDIEYLFFHWMAEFNGLKDDVCINAGIDGYGKYDYDGNSDEGNFSISLCSLNELLDCPLQINKKFVIVKPNNGIDPCNILIDCERYFTLYDIIGALLHDISFYGSPEEKVIEAEKIQATLDRVINGEEKFTSFDELNKNKE